MNGGGFGGLDFGSLTPEQREYLLKMLPNLTGQEEEVQHQQALAAQLRRPDQNKRMDWGSQGARAIQGLTSGYLEGQAQKTRAGLGPQYQTVAQKIAELSRRRPDELGGGSLAGGLAGYEDLWGRS